MAEITPEVLQNDIKEILDGADLSSLSVKKIRKQLEEKHQTDLTERKEEIDKMVMAVLSPPEPKADKKSKESNGKSNGADDDGEESSDFDEPEDGPSPAKRAKTDKKKAAKSDGPKRKNGYMQEYLLSPALAEVMGTDKMARSDVVKRMWEIIRERDLQDPKNKQFMRCDDQLMAIFGRRRVRTFGMMKYLKDHFTKQ